MCCVVGEVVGVGGGESGGGIGGGGELLSGSGGRRWGGSGQRSIAGRAPAALLRAWRGRLELVGEAEMATRGPSHLTITQVSKLTSLIVLKPCVPGSYKARGAFSNAG